MAGDVGCPGIPTGWNNGSVPLEPEFRIPGETPGPPGSGGNCDGEFGVGGDIVIIGGGPCAPCGIADGGSCVGGRMLNLP